MRKAATNPYTTENNTKYVFSVIPNYRFLFAPKILCASLTKLQINTSLGYNACIVVLTYFWVHV